MTTYTKDKKDAVKEEIKDLIGEFFDRYTLYDILQKAEEGMDEKLDIQELADSLYDFINDNYSDNAFIAASLDQCMPKSEIIVFRNELIRAFE